MNQSPENNDIGFVAFLLAAILVVAVAWTMNRNESDRQRIRNLDYRIQILEAKEAQR